MRNRANRQGKWSKIARWAAQLALVVAVVVGTFAGWIWIGSTEKTIDSDALEEARAYRIFNPQSDGVLIYSLDGQTFRNGLAPATVFSAAAFIRGERLPRIVAIHSTANRDRDFRPPSSTPTYWRPSIEGRSPAFDRFLIDELIPHIEQQTPERRFLLGHSLAGLYALDLATRQPTRFTGVFAFAPTFSHDMSIVERLPMACGEGHLLYANWGLESARDTKVFREIAEKWAGAEACKADPPVISRHYGSIHQTIMMTGQVHAAFGLMD